jgi:hypothetical protein
MPTGEEGHLEAAMGMEAAKSEGRNRMLAGAGWVAGISVMLVEMQFGMDYVLSHVTQGMSAILCWLPMVGVFARQFWG